MAYPSLFEYLTKEIGYSAGSAQRRIEAARLMQKLPEVGDQVESGKLNLVQISQMQRTLRQVRKDTGVIIPLEKQKDILAQLENLPNSKTEIFLNQEFGLCPLQAETQKHQADESIRVEMTLLKEEAEFLKSLQEKYAHQLHGSRNLKDLFLLLANKSSPSTPEAKPGKIQNRTLTRKTKNFILQRDQVCQYQDPESRKICGSKAFLQVDHIQPQWAGGKHHPENLRALCQKHNLYRYQTGR